MPYPDNVLNRTTEKSVIISAIRIIRGPIDLPKAKLSIDAMHL